LGLEVDGFAATFLAAVAIAVIRFLLALLFTSILGFAINLLNAHRCGGILAPVRVG
jgi:hypothetical protein